MPRNTLILIIALLATACSPPEVEDSLKEKAYFNLTGFVTEQKELLETNPPPSITKTIIVNGEEETKEETEEAFVQLLNFLKDNDLNRPAYTGLYREETISPSESSTSFYEKRYILKEEHNAPVQSLRLFYDNSEAESKNLQGIYLLKETRTILYNTWQIITIQLQNNQLRKADMLTHQQILYFSPTRFKVEVLANA